MGANRWRSEADWPLSRARSEAWYLHSEGAAGPSGGTLSPDAPGDEPPDCYEYDPSSPAPTIGGPTSLPARLFAPTAGPKNHAPAEARPDVLVYTSAPLEQGLEVTGPLSFRLYAASDAPDTDWVVRLMDVHPDGPSMILAEGILRARYREGYDRPRPLRPGELCAYDIDLAATSNVFRPGHRIRVAITSSSFPRFDRNPNTGNPLGADAEEDLRPARQTVFHDGRSPSHLLLPVVRD